MRESLLNVFHWRSRMTVLVLVAVVWGLAVAFLSVTDSRALIQQVENLDSQGRNVAVFVSASSTAPAAISRHSCESLVSAEGVERAGGVIADGQASVLQLGGTVPVMRVSSSLVQELRSADAVVGSALPFTRGSGLIDTSRGVVSAVHAQREPQGVDVNSALVLPLEAHTASFSECVAVLSPSSVSPELIRVLQSQLRSSGNPLVASTVLESPVDPVAAYLTRPTQYFPLLLGLVAGVLNLAILMSRSSELAAYRVSGTSRRSLSVLLGLEQVLVSGVAALSCSMTSLVFRAELIDPAATIAWSGAGCAVWLAVSAIGAAAIAMRSTLTLTKSR